MKVKMPWLKTRLREIGSTPTALARDLKVQPPRVYEMISGNRAMQPKEIEPTARHLKWSVEELLKHLPEGARTIPAGLNRSQGLIPVLGTRPPTGKVSTSNFDCLLTGETTHYVKALPAFMGRVDIQSLYLHSPVMTPWRSRGELVIFETERPPRESDHVVIYLVKQDHEQPVLVRQLLRQKGNKLHLLQHSPIKETEIDLAKVASIYRVITWDDAVR